jgi:superfamily II DNA or RNA helicase
MPDATAGDNPAVALLPLHAPMTRPMPPVSYAREQIEDWLGRDVVAQARDYANAVSDLRWDDDALSGKVRRTLQQPCDVHVRFRGAGGTLRAAGTCSCPTGFDCKHVAALLIAGLARVQPRPGARAELVNWLEGFLARRVAAPPDGKKSTAASSHAIAYVLAWSSYRRRHEVQLYKARVNSAGTIRGLDQPWSNVEAALLKPPKFVTDEDLTILRGLWLGRAHADSGGFALQGSNGAAVLEKLIRTGRVYAARDGEFVRPLPPIALRPGAVRSARVEWQAQADARLRPVLMAEPPATMMLTTDPAWYVDVQTAEAAPLNLPWAADYLADYLSIPPIDPAEAPLVGAVLREHAPDLPLPPAHDTAAPRVIDAEPVPVLSLDSLSAYAWGWHVQGLHAGTLDFATVSFDYEGVSVDAHSNATLQRDTHGEVVQLQRRRDAEQRRLRELRTAGLVKVPADRFSGPRQFPAGMHALKDAEDWPDFMRAVLPQLRASGWRVVMSGAFRFNVIEIDGIDGAVRPAGEGWFDLEMGITVGERTVRLEPLLAELFERDGRWLSGGLDGIADDEAIDLKSDRGERLRLRADRLKPVVRVLIDLFDTLGQGSLRVRAWDAGRLQALEHIGRWQFHGDTSIRQLAQRLQAGQGMRKVPVPQGLRAELRAYQHQGLSWMQFLREHGLCGVLADDMGLGKTVQTLAHVLAEKEAGRLDRPALIVVPTTLVHNWREEAQRFAPDLRVLDLQGPQRKDRFDRIGEHDLVLTTYPLLWRDQAALAEHDYHLLILDEAQYVKNATTKAATTIRELRARHRLCLTGTPLENHLGELWSQFDFLLPGFLGTQKDYTRRWRTPIERGGDTVRRELLARRIRPFMLRRRKDEVARELPPKTIIVRTVDLQGAQRDLYETVRTAMQEKVRAAITAQGLARSHLIVLDALLKLRQVCCDPRLVKLDKAARVKESAKLELLLDMAPELIEEGRRILLFSQFTGMLSLIAAALEQAHVPYVVLTGDTADRVAPVKRFTQGEVPMMLISLKAGGVGLNLTAADTVIHYDPWWNPAAENQATDRAHRIGQDKPVFVYKLIAAGSIEEKIVALQQHKAALADAILSEDRAGAVKFSAEDLQALFEPMPGVAPARGA